MHTQFDGMIILRALARCISTNSRRVEVGRHGKYRLISYACGT